MNKLKYKIIRTIKNQYKIKAFILIILKNISVKILQQEEQLILRNQVLLRQRLLFIINYNNIDNNQYF
jgi:hypothetical protein